MNEKRREFFIGHLPENCPVCNSQKIEDNRKLRNSDPMTEALYWSREVVYSCGAKIAFVDRGFVGGSAFVQYGYVVRSGCNTALQEKMDSLYEKVGQKSENVGGI